MKSYHLLLLSLLTVSAGLRAENPTTGRSGELFARVLQRPAIADATKGLTPSPDNRHLYIFGTELSLLSKNPTSGRLNLEATYNTAVHPDFESIVDVIIPEDGRHVYALAGSPISIFVFERNQLNGSLTLSSVVTSAQLLTNFATSPIGLAVSVGGENIYTTHFTFVTGGEVGTFARDANTGSLSFVNALPQSTLRFPISMKATPDSRHMIGAARFGDVVLFARDQPGGALREVKRLTIPDGLVSPWIGDMELSPDGEHLYVSDLGSETVWHFKVDGLNSNITRQPKFYRNNQTDASGRFVVNFVDPRKMDISRDGCHLYVATSQAVNTFQRNPVSGTLHINDTLPTALEPKLPASLRDVTVSKDGKYVYVQDGNTSGISVLQRQWVGTVAGDYDGDGVADQAVIELTNGAWFWYIRSMSGAPIAVGLQWGDASMVPAPGDYNGDGITDLGMYQPSTGLWYIRHVRDGLPPLVFGFQWGGPDMTPVPGDYNQDGVHDFAVYQQSTGNWFIRTLRLGAPPLLFGESWGGPGRNAVK